MIVAVKTKKSCYPVEPTKLLSKSFGTFFSNVIKGKDSTEVKAEQNKNMEKAGLITTKTSEMFDDIEALVKTLNVDSIYSNYNKDNLSKVASKYLKSPTAFIASQPCLHNFPKCQELRADSRFEAFFKNYEIIVDKIQLLVQHPVTAKEFVTSQRADDFARFTVLIAEASARAVEIERTHNH